MVERNVEHARNVKESMLNNSRAAHNVFIAVPFSLCQCSWKIISSVSLV